MSEEELNDPDHYAWQEGDPLRGELLGNGLWFPCNQLTTCALQQGNAPFAFSLQAALIEEMRQSTLPPEDVAGSIYNAACFSAMHGQPEQALQLLPEAFHLKPTLLEWARHDTDLDSLRTNPAFQAICTDPTLLALVPVSDLISPQDLHASASGETPPLIIDVRGATEYAAGHVAGAVNIPLGKLKRSLTQIPQDRRVITYCNMHHRGGSRGEQAAILLSRQGYQARTLDGGYPAWKEQDFPVEAALQVE
jgi:rhodanese-related sulfurtransferase